MSSLESMAIFVKIEEEGVPLVGEDPLLSAFHLYWFFIDVILIPLRLHIVMYGLIFSMLLILMYDVNYWSNLWMVQVNIGSNGEGYSLIIIDSSNYYIPV